MNPDGQFMLQINKHVSLSKSFTEIAHKYIFSVPRVPFEEEFFHPDSHNTDVPIAPSPINAPKRFRLHAYLDDLNLRPNDSPVDHNEPNVRNSAIGLKPSISTSLGLTTSSSFSHTANHSSYAPAANANRNPEADSFTYIETLLESLAVLGKLGGALDVVAQKLPQEIYQVVEATLDEVEERAEYGRRASMLTTLMPGVDLNRLEEIYSMPIRGSMLGFVSGVVSLAHTATNASTGVNQSQLSASTLRLIALETSTKVGDQEIMRDFFWTLYSKLDAISQGLRAVYEVANRIGSVSFAFVFYELQLSFLSVEEGFQGLIWSQAWISLPVGRCLDPCSSRGI